jgi:hypothetical protein
MTPRVAVAGVTRVRRAQSDLTPRKIFDFGVR